ncbi:Peptidoglycan/LPS O-acetylase OafA/YrhL, contains acyltransferase and SGNH-hydrolase domains [Actinacidiphila yanglinensis]|uniref:Peptidoglycan/LPS O-acetylase OafA/YrhL, contains acyltransferase and SGNH-hydrolase domains n=1 Tax=Actinacidiphila yanglinensis TaxID=310779 RepID=A0A1H6DE36_9ACTN|nr:acyltransferase [Actinacidiphila yanglinensis]SEG83481.1 Peptidoglycan/LPS O-acetylase OafA/YrhL, contains acyltransferase and SGNH-hydrolase domains [Actinacidiphila yanglinensis]
MSHTGTGAQSRPQRHAAAPGGTERAGGTGPGSGNGTLPVDRTGPVSGGGPGPEALPEAVPAPAPAPSPTAATSATASAGAGRRRGRERPRLYAIDALRLTAALMVAVHHYVGTYRVDKPHNPIWDQRASHMMPTVFRLAAYGWVGVEIFFVISGFVICMSCWDRRPRDFFVSRVIRLYPAYWFGVVFTTAVLTALPAVWPRPSIRQMVFNLSMLQSGAKIGSVDSVYWTLWSELRFYLVFLVVVATGLTYRKVVVFCCVWGTLAALAPVSGFPALQLLADRDSTWYFIAGLALYLMHRFGPDLLLWGILAMSWVMASDELGRRIVHEGVSSWRGAMILFTLFLLVMVGVAVGWTDRLQWKWLATAGSLTYPFYLIHYAAGTTAIHYLHDRADPRVLVVSVLAAALLLSYGVHQLVERPLARSLKRGLTGAFDRLGSPPG